MADEKARRRAEFQEGTWVRMGDGQDWMFPRPPAPGCDREYDDLIRCHHEAEDADDALVIELALAIRLLSRNYAPRPDEYFAIFSFGEDHAARAHARAAISELINADLEAERVNGQSESPAAFPLHASFHTL